MADLLDGFFGGTRWLLAWPHILVALLVPLVIVTVADRLIRHRR